MAVRVAHGPLSTLSSTHVRARADALLIDDWPGPPLPTCARVLPKCSLCFPHTVCTTVIAYYIPEEVDSKAVGCGKASWGEQDRGANQYPLEDTNASSTCQNRHICEYI